MPHSESVLPLGVPIAPTEPTDANSTHIAEYGRGGLHSVANLAARTSISADRKRVGMLVWVESEQKYYRLSVLPDTWVEFATGGSGTVTSITPAADNGNGTAITTSGTISVVGTANEVTTSVTGTTVTVGLPDAITVVEVNADNADFNTAAAVADAVGRLRWDSAYSTLSLGLDADVQLKIGQGLYKLARNNSGGPIAKGEVVYVSGSHGGTQLAVSKASNASEVTSAETIGVAAEAIANNASGMVQTFGYLEGITTNGFAGAEGSPLYLGATAGTMQSNLPTPPAHGVRVGFLVKKAGAGAGSIFVNIQNYQEIEELSDFLKGTYADFDLMSYDLAAGVWRNRTVANALPTNSVALNKLAQIANNRLLGNSVGAAASPSAIAVSSPLGFNGVSGNLEIVAPGSAGQVFFHSSGGFGTSSFFSWNNATSTLTLSNALAESVSFSPSGITANGPFTISDTGGGNSTAFTIDDASETATFANFLAVDMTGATLTVDAIVLANGEFLSNAANGTLKLGVNGTNALEYSMLVDGTSWGYGVKLSTSQNSNPSNTSAGFWFVSPLQISTGVPLSFDAAQTSGVQHVGAFTGTRLATHLSVSLGSLVQYGQDSSGALCIVDHAALGAANRRPNITHADPTLYVYARGSADATDFARMSHDTTDALLESGSGKLRLKGASVVRIEGSGGGFDIDPTPNSNGSVMTLNNGVVSFQTPTGGGVSEDDVIALAVAL